MVHQWHVSSPTLHVDSIKYRNWSRDLKQGKRNCYEDLRLVTRIRGSEILVSELLSPAFLVSPCRNYVAPGTF